MDSPSGQTLSTETSGFVSQSREAESLTTSSAEVQEAIVVVTHYCFYASLIVGVICYIIQSRMKKKASKLYILPRIICILSLIIFAVLLLVIYVLAPVCTGCMPF